MTEKVGGGLLSSGATTITVTPGYEAVKCVAGELPATVTMEGCDYVIHIGETTASPPHEYEATADLICPAGKEVVVHVYLNASETLNACTIKIPEQKGLKGLDIRHFTASEGDDIELTGKITTIKASKEKVGCGGVGSTEEAQLEVNVTITGTDKDGKATPVTVTDTAV